MKSTRSLTLIVFLLGLCFVISAPHATAQTDDGNGKTSDEIYESGLHTAGWQKNATVERTKGIFRLRNLNFLYDEYQNRLLPTRNIPFSTDYIKNLVASIFFETLLTKEEFDALEGGDYMNLLDPRIEKLTFAMPVFGEKGTMPRVSGNRAEVRYDDGSIIKFTDSEQDDLFNERSQKFSIIPGQDLNEDTDTPDNYERISKIGVAGDILFNGNFRMIHPQFRADSRELDYYMEYIQEAYIRDTKDAWNEPGSNMTKGIGHIRRYTKTVLHYMIKDSAPNGDITWLKKWEEYLNGFNEITNFNQVFIYVNSEQDAWDDWEKKGRPASISLHLFDTDDVVETEFGVDYEVGHIWATRTTIGIEDFTTYGSQYYGMHPILKELFLYSVFLEWFRSHTGLTGYQTGDVGFFIASHSISATPLLSYVFYEEEKIAMAWVMGRLSKARVYRANGRWVDNDSRVDLDKLAASLEYWYNTSDGEADTTANSTNTNGAVLTSNNARSSEKSTRRLSPREQLNQHGMKLVRSPDQVESIKRAAQMNTGVRAGFQVLAMVGGGTGY